MRKFCYWQNASLLNGISSMCSTACCTLMFIWPSWARCWPEMLFALENGKWMICHDLAKRFYYTVPLQCNAQEFGSPADIAFYFIKLHSSHTHKRILYAQLSPAYFFNKLFGLNFSKSSSVLFVVHYLAPGLIFFAIPLLVHTQRTMQR